MKCSSLEMDMDPYIRRCVCTHDLGTENTDNVHMYVPKKLLISSKTRLSRRILIMISNLRIV